MRYRNQQNEVRQSDTVDGRIVVAPETDEFRVNATEATVPVGSSEVVRLNVTNTENETLRNIEAKLFTNDPLSSDSDEAFIPTLEPGESATILFEVSSAGDALPKVYPVSVDFTYEDERGDTVLSETYRVPIEVTERERRGPLPFAIQPGLVAVASLMVVAAFVWWKRETISERC